MIRPDNTEETADLLLSIDSGTSTLKFMANFVTKKASQMTTVVMILSEAHGVREKFRDLSRKLHSVTDEIDNIVQNGFRLSEEHLTYYFLCLGLRSHLCADRKLRREINFCCLWCCTPKTFMY